MKRSNALFFIAYYRGILYNFGNRNISNLYSVPIAIRRLCGNGGHGI